VYIATDATLDMDATNINADPLFVSSEGFDYFLSQTAAGQPSNSPCVDAGSDTAVNLGLDQRTTRTDLAPDSGIVDMGYHASRPFWITDVYWDQGNTSVVVEFNSLSGIDYVVETVDTPVTGYAEELAWSNWLNVSATSCTTTVVDDFSTRPLVGAFRFYRVRRADTASLARQTVGVFQLKLTSTPETKFISTPLIPDPDHASVREIFGEDPLGGDPSLVQIPRDGLQIRDLNEEKRTYNTMLFSLQMLIWQVVAGDEFNIEAGVGYELLMGSGPNENYKLRFTGYVPETDMEVPMTKCWTYVAPRWFAYPMPGSIGLADLGIEDAVTPWYSLNQVRLLFPNTSTWITYRYNEAYDYWYEETEPGVPVNPTISCGMGVEFLRFGPPDDEDVLVCERWYEHPPND
jgi:hypothetical protein